MPLILGIVASGNYPRVTNSYESISTTTLGAGGAATVEFTSIVNTYKHLQLRVLSRSNRAVSTDNIKLGVGNGTIDTGANYAYHNLYGNGTSAAASGGSSETTGYLDSIPGSSIGASIFGVLVIDFLDYANTNKYKTVRSLGGYDSNGGGFISLTSNLWQSTSAIDRIKLTCRGTAFEEYSSFALYGIKG